MFEHDRQQASEMEAKIAPLLEQAESNSEHADAVNQGYTAQLWERVSSGLYMATHALQELNRK